MTTIKCRNLLLLFYVIINSDYEFDGDWMQQEPRLLASNHDLSDGFAFWQTTKVKKIHPVAFDDDLYFNTRRNKYILPAVNFNIFVNEQT